MIVAGAIAAVANALNRRPFPFVFGGDGASFAVSRADAPAAAAALAAHDFADWGVFRQKAAQLTCFVPSVRERGHVHFVDGADGGYATAATAMKARRHLQAAKAA
jgi:hypothetical protein